MLLSTDNIVDVVHNIVDNDLINNSIENIKSITLNVGNVDNTELIDTIVVVITVKIVVNENFVDNYVFENYIVEYDNIVYS